MTASTLPLAAGAPAALAAFLRGVERRAAVLAELLCGHPRRGDQALAAAMRAFRNAAARGPIADWPMRFWSLLLAVPQLRHPVVDPFWPDAFASLARLETGLRAALLLRLVVELDDEQAGAVLGIAPATYRHALQRALPRQSDGSPDPMQWRALAAATQHKLRQLPAARLVSLAQLRETAILGRQHHRPDPARAPVPGRWLQPALWSAASLCALAFVGTFLLPDTRWVAADMPHLRAVPLPAATPIATFDAQTALLTHPDFDQLADSRHDVLVDGLDFYAWYAAQVLAKPGADGAPLLLPDAGAPLPPARPAAGGARAAR